VFLRLRLRSGGFWLFVRAMPRLAVHTASPSATKPRIRRSTSRQWRALLDQVQWLWRACPRAASLLCYWLRSARRAGPAISALEADMGAHRSPTYARHFAPTKDPLSCLAIRMRRVFSGSRSEFTLHLLRTPSIIIRLERLPPQQPTRSHAAA
jgi:hypothetical protein